MRATPETAAGPDRFHSTLSGKRLAPPQINQNKQTHPHRNWTGRRGPCIWITDTNNSRIERWTTSTASASQTIYYSSGTEASVAACQNHPEWANLVCQTQPVQQPETVGLPSLPLTTYTYNIWDEPEIVRSTTQTGTGEATRTETTTYDAAGRTTSKETTSTTGISLPKVTNEYSSETGLLTKQSTGSGTEERKITTGYNTVGQMVTYTDADEQTTTYEYENGKDDRLKSVNDGKGTQTYIYDEEKTGFIKELADSAAGTFTATYDIEGRLATETMPNGLTNSLVYNPTGEAISLEYTKKAYCGVSCTWYSDTVVPTIHGQWASQTSGLASQAYSYDGTGRLAQVQNTPAGKGCTTRIYSYDQDGNRTSLVTRPPGTEGKCATEGGTVETHYYDTADRLVDPEIGYNAFGDIETVSANDAGGSKLTSQYYVDGQVASQEQLEQTIGYNLDPVRRIRETVSSGKVTATETQHYPGPGNSSSWSSEPSGNWSRNIGGILGGLEAIQHNGGSPVLQIANLHGDIVATATDSETATALASTIGEPGEYGIPATETPPKYSWLGAHQLPTQLPSGATVMGARSYVPQLGRFLQPDPSPGGSANAYTYTYGNPLNETDLSGAETSGGLSALGEGEGMDLAGGVGLGEGAIMPPPVNLQIEAAFEASPPWDQATAGVEEYEEYEEYEEWGEEYAAFGPSPHSVGASEAEVEGVYMQPLGETSGSRQKPLPLCEDAPNTRGLRRTQGRPCGRYVCSFPTGCIKAVGKAVAKVAKKVWRSIKKAAKAVGEAGHDVYCGTLEGAQAFAEIGCENSTFCSTVKKERFGRRRRWKGCPS